MQSLNLWRCTKVGNTALSILRVRFQPIGKLYSSTGFWSHHDSSEFGISQEQRGILLEHLKQCWEFSHIEVPLPQAIND